MSFFIWNCFYNKFIIVGHPKTWPGCTWTICHVINRWFSDIYLDCPSAQVALRQLNLENLQLKCRKYHERIEKRVEHMIWNESLRTCVVQSELCHILENKLIRQFQNLESKHHDQSNENQQKLLYQVAMHHLLNLGEHLYNKHLLKSNTSIKTSLMIAIIFMIGTKYNCNDSDCGD